MSKIHVYFMPGMMANPLIFEKIHLPEEHFEMHLLEWIQPKKEESVEDYAKRVAMNVKHDFPVLVGVSFGGILVQEMKKYVNPRRVIIISSIKSKKELPLRMRIARMTKAYKLIPTHLFINVEFFSKYVFKLYQVRHRISLYKKYLTVRDKNYLDWSIHNIVNWGREEADGEVIHIQGSKDEVFPLKNIVKCIVVEGGTHIMIINRYKWLNENLPKLMQD